MSSRKAFTLIELLVVIAIIAILAAILFPVFAQAKAAAKFTASLSNVKQFGTAHIMYTNDYDDLFPLAGVLRPEAGGTLGMGLDYPIPANNGEVLSSGNTIWQGQSRIAMASCYEANAVQPYAKNYDIGAFPSSVQFNASRTFPGGAGFVAPKYWAQTYNGDLHRLSTTAVASPSIAVMLWAGNGDEEDLGLVGCQPALNCQATVDDCMFNPGGHASASDVTFPGASEAAYGEDLMFLPNNPHANLSFSATHKGPMTRTDTSAKANPQGTAVFPTYNSAAGAFIDPFETIEPTKSDQFLNWSCSDGQTPVASGSFENTYICFFRPDRVK